MKWEIPTDLQRRIIFSEVRKALVISRTVRDGMGFKLLRIFSLADRCSIITFVTDYYMVF